ncbi:protein C3orf33 homolog isoform X2 [Gigantopelta aegis]|uniref:protein C3orf33 homolog isoform X2 n=1 Tax=Gigantopelta aegis TaxID=1735272 RepID=UPI001B88E1A0|nr:protein C3orf33 homolog isoform X2 [Gigantopelta aegis]
MKQNESRSHAKNDNSQHGTNRTELTSRHWKDDLFNFFDSHIRELQTTKFTSVGQIPTSYIEKNVTLQGNVRYVTDTGSLLTQHQPILQTPTWLSSQNDEGLLPVEIIGVAVTPGGRKWLIDSIKDRHVWFKLLRSSPSSVQCIVYRKPGFLRKVNVNEELIKMGFGKVHFVEDQPFSDSHLHGQVLERLLKLESVAERKGLGMWKATKENKIEKVAIFHKLKNLILFPVKYFRKQSSEKKGF